jgi:ectoine hydroxylase-related dioxygenase (phytanoyl-CoA dioxygenase family)
MATIEEHALELEVMGYTLLESCIDARSTESAMKALLAEYEHARPMPWVGGGKWFGHLNYVPSPSNHVIRETASNRKIEAVLHCALGKDLKIVGFGGNANLPNSRYQPAHTDGWLGTDFLVVNIPLGNITESNGSTEVWPQTHKEHLTVSQFKAVHRQSVRLNAAPGDVIIRYSNLWHRGTPNRSSDVRIMLSLVASRFYERLPPLTVSEGEAADLLSFGLPVSAKTGPEFKRGFAPNYFGPNLKGNILELTWMFAPMMFTAIRSLKKSSI